MVEQLSFVDPKLSPGSPLQVAMEAFEAYMQREEFSEHTINSFLGDLRLLADYLGFSKPIGSISTEDLNAFLYYLVHERGKPCSPKSYARRVTTLKVFFRWLHEENVLEEDPAAPVIQKSVRAPLPKILSDEEVERALEVARARMEGERGDPRPYLLLLLLLHTGIKKAECMRIQLEHIDRHDPSAPMLYVYYPQPRQRHKERRLRLPPEIVPVLERYLEVYKPEGALFPCTARNLEYVLHEIAREAEIEDGISFEQLRWTAAVRDFRAGMDEETLRKKLGLSEVSWVETGEKIRKLASDPL